MSTVRTLTYLNLLAFTVHLVSGVLGSIIAHQGNPRVYAYAPLVSFNSGGEPVFRQTPVKIFGVGAFTGLLLFAYITAAFHLVYIAVINLPAADALVRRYVVDSSSLNPLRWVEYSITATILSAFGQLSIGNSSFYFFLTTLGAGFTLQYYGLIIEKLSYTDARDRNVALIIWNLATITNLLPVAILLYQLFASETHNVQIFAYNIFPYFIWFQTFGVICWLDFMNWRQFADPKFTEKWYLILSLSTKFTIFWLGFATFREIGVKEGWTGATPGVDWRTVRLTVSYLPLAVVGGVALRDAYAWRQSGGKGSEDRSALLAAAPTATLEGGGSIAFGAARFRHVAL